MRAQPNNLRACGAALIVLMGAASCTPQPPTSLAMDPVDPDVQDLELATREAARVAYVQGTYLRELGDGGNALLLFRHAVRLLPADPEPRLALARAALESGRVAEAEALLAAAAARGEASAAEHLLLARLTAVGGTPAEVLPHVERALAADSSLAAAWFLRGRVLADLGQDEAALASLLRVDALEPNRAATQLQVGAACARLGRPAEAEHAYRHALLLEPQFTPARAALVEMYERAGRVSDAIALQEEAVHLDPNDPAALEELIQLHLRTQRHAELVQLLSSLQEQGELEPRREYILGWALLQLRREAEAEEVLRGLSERVRMAGVENLLGELYLRQDRFAAAEERFRAAIRLEPEECAAHVGLVTVLLERMRASEQGLRAPSAAGDSLRASLDAAAALTPASEFRCNVLLGFAYAQLRDFAAAARHLETGRSLEPRNADVLFNLAMAKQELGSFDEAIALGRDVLALEPENPAALNFLGYIQAERGMQLEESEGLIQRALQVEPDNGYYVDSLGWVFYQMGRFDQAVDALERAVQLTESKDAIILEHLGDAYDKAGRPQEAQRVYLQSRALAPENAALGQKLAALQEKLGRP